jgi:hypothetical protein
MVDEHRDYFIEKSFPTQARVVVIGGQKWSTSIETTSLKNLSRPRQG